jgi:hypothetical protein
MNDETTLKAIVVWLNEAAEDLGHALDAASRLEASGTLRRDLDDRRLSVLELRARIERIIDGEEPIDKRWTRVL